MRKGEQIESAGIPLGMGKSPFGTSCPCARRYLFRPAFGAFLTHSGPSLGADRSLFNHHLARSEYMFHMLSRCSGPGRCQVVHRPERLGHSWRPENNHRSPPESLSHET
jgi:hypothetical protein